jgi:predicted transcriptional regulator
MTENKQKITKNEQAWKKLFEKYNILKKIEKNGYFEIEAAQINEERESRLMAKFDHYVNLPTIFRDNNLSILPISRSKYIIGQFDTYCKVEENKDIEPLSWHFLRLESINYENLYSESSALHCAFNMGIIDDVLEEESYYTVSGRMSTGEFDFHIKNIINDRSNSIVVTKSQCEIDGGFESENFFAIIEAKNYSIDDFLIRQLYYPYRLWSDKISKKVIPILMTYSNDIFTFLIYKFEDPLDYNSIKLVSCKKYIIEQEEISLADVSIIFSNSQIIPEYQNSSPKISFPQADKFERIVDLLSLLTEKDLTKEEITENYQFDPRQTRYYTRACLYLGLIETYKEFKTKEIKFKLTVEGRKIFRKKSKLKYLDLIKKILEHEVFYKSFEKSIFTGEVPSKREICEIMIKSGLTISESTQERRAGTVKRWLDWIWSKIKKD